MKALKRWENKTFDLSGLHQTAHAFGFVPSRPVLLLPPPDPTRHSTLPSPPLPVTVPTPPPPYKYPFLTAGQPQPQPPPPPPHPDPLPAVRAQKEPVF